jgi:16S rRNA (adenine1518-N6/adenine1519-N6)-dimethyltransferase
MDSPSALLRRYGLRAKKSWGQCFLHDPSVLDRIVVATGVGVEDAVLEIGAGLGSLTARLCAVARRVIAVERDRELAEVLRTELGSDAKLELLEANALTLELAALGEPLVVVGNLPYNIASPLLFRILEQRAVVRRATLMLQRELAERLAAPPGGRLYGAPSVLLQDAAQVRLCFVVPGGAFVPRPRVESAVLRLDFREHPRSGVPFPQLQRVVHAAFRQRRKTLRRALESAFGAAAVSAALEWSNLDGSRRGETLSVEEFGALATALAAVEAPR